MTLSQTCKVVTLSQTTRPEYFVSGQSVSEVRLKYIGLGWKVRYHDIAILQVFVGVLRIVLHNVGDCLREAVLTVLLVMWPKQQSNVFQAQSTDSEIPLSIERQTKLLDFCCDVSHRNYGWSLWHQWEAFKLTMSNLSNRGNRLPKAKYGVF